MFWSKKMSVIALGVALLHFGNANAAGAVNRNGAALQLLRTLTWTGGVDNKWSTASNWSPAAVPGSGDILVFGTALTQTNYNDLPAGMSFTSIQFTTAGFTLGGNSLVLTGGATALNNNVASGGNTINFNIAFGTNAGTITCLAGGSLTLNSTIDNGGLPLTVASAGTTALGGTISGLGGLVISAAGTTLLEGSNTYTGDTLINAGTLSLDYGVIGASEVFLNTGASLSGSGTLGGTLTATGTNALSPSIPLGIGPLNTGAVTLSSGTTFAVQLSKAIAGVGYSNLNVTGAVNLNGATLSASIPGLLQNQSNPIVTSTAPIVGTFNGLPEGASLNIGGRQFTISYLNNNVTLTYTAETRNWSGLGADNNWTTGANWEGGVAPGAGDTLIFGAQVQQLNVDDYPNGFSLASIQFNAAGFTLQNQAEASRIVLTGGATAIQNNVAGSNLMTLTPTFKNSPATISNVAGGTLYMSCAFIDPSNQTLTVASSGFTTIDCNDIFNSGGIVKTGTGVLRLLENDTNLSGSITVSAGTLQIGNAFEVGSIGGCSDLAIASGAHVIFWNIYNGGSLPTAISCNISGAGSILFNGTNSATKFAYSSYTLTGNNSSFAGTLSINAASVQCGAANTLGAAAIDIQALGQLYLSGGVSCANNITVEQNAGWWDNGFMLGAIRLEGNNTLSGNIVLNDTAAIVTGDTTGLNSTMGSYTGGEQHLTGAISGPGNFNLSRYNRKGGVGAAANFYLDGAASNTYTGNTVVDGQAAQTSLWLNKTGSAVAIPPNNTIQMGSNTTGAANLRMAQNNQFGANVVMNFANITGQFMRFDLKGTSQTLLGINAGATGTQAGAVIQNQGIDGIVPGGDGTLTLNGGGTYLYNGYIRDQDSGGHTTKTNLIFAGNTQTLAGATLGYTGTTSVNGGTLELFNSSGYASPTTVNTGGTLRLNNNTGISVSATSEVLNLAGGTLSFVGTGYELWNANFNPTGTSTLNVTNSGANNQLFFDNGMTGSGTFTVNNTGAATTGVHFRNTTNNTTGNFAGSIVVNNGEIAIGSNAAQWFSFADVTLNGATLQEGAAAFSMIAANPVLKSLNGNGTVTSAGSTTSITVGAGNFSGSLINGVGGNLSLTKNTSGTLTLSSANSYSGTTTISSGALQIGNGTNSTATLGTGNVIDNGTLTFNLTGSPAPISNVISGTGGLIQAGTGNLILTGDNSYAGTTKDLIVTLQPGQGALQIGNGGTTGSLGTGPVTTNFDLIFNRTDRVNVSNSIGGPGNLIQSGTGIVSLSGAGTYTGQTSINSGTLLVNGSIAAASAVVLNSGATLGGNGTLGGTVTATGTTAVIPGDPLLNSGIGQLNTGPFMFDASSGSTFSAQIGGATAGVGYTNLNVAGAVNLNDTTLSVSIPGLLTAKTFPIITSTSAIAGTFRGYPEGAKVAINASSSQDFFFTISYLGNKVTLHLPQTLTWTGGGANNNWSTASNWSPAATPGSGDTLVFGTALKQTNTNDLPAGMLVNSIQFTTAGFTVGGNSLVLTGGAAALNNNVAGANTINCNIAFGTAGGTITCLAGGSLSVGGTIDNGGLPLTVASDGSTTLGGIVSGTGSLTKTNAGALTLLGINTYAGITSIKAGVINIKAESGLGGNPAAFNAAQLTLDGGTLNATANTNIVSSNRGITLGASGGTFSSNPSVTFTISNVIAGSGSLTKTNAGTLTLLATNTYTGITSINAGVINIRAESNLGGNPTAFNAAQLTLNGGTLNIISNLNIMNSNRGITLGASGGTFSSNPNGTFTISNVIAGSGSLTKTCTSLLSTSNVVVSANNTFTGDIHVISGALTVMYEKTTLGLGNKTVYLVNGSVGKPELHLYWANIIGPNISFVTDNAITGAIVNDTGSYANIQGTVTLAGNTNIVSQTGTVTISGNVTASAPGLSLGLVGPGSGILSGIVSDGATTALPVTINGGGWIFSGVNTYSGPTTVSAPVDSSGNLLVDGSLSASSSVTINDGCWLGGNGTINGPVVAMGASTIRPGSYNTPGILNTGPTTFGFGSIFDVIVGGPIAGIGYGNLNVTGTVNLNGPDLNVRFEEKQLTATTFPIITSTNPIVGTFRYPEGTIISIQGPSQVYLFTISYLGNKVTLHLRQTLTWTGGGADNNWSTASNWSPAATPGSGDTLIFGTALQQNNTNDLPAGMVFNSIQFTTAGFTVGGNSVVLSGGAAALNNNVAGLNTLNCNIAIGTSAGTITCLTGGSLSLAGSIDNGGLPLTVASAGSTTFGGSISGAGDLINSAAGTTILSGDCTYTGVTTVSAGTLQIGNGGTAGTLGTGPVTNNGGLIFNRTDTYNVSNVIDGIAALTQGGTGTVILTGLNTYTGATNVIAGTLQIGKGGTTGSISAASAVSVSGGAAMIWNNNQSTSNAWIANAISGAGTVLLQGQNDATHPRFSSYTLSNINSTFSGTLSLNGASVSCGDPANLGSAAIDIQANGQFYVNGNTTYANNITVEQNAGWWDAGLLLGAIRMEGSNTLTGNILLNDTAAVVPGDISGLNSTIACFSGGTQRLTGVLSGPGNFQVCYYTGYHGQVDIFLEGSASNTYTGTTVVDGQGAANLWLNKTGGAVAIAANNTVQVGNNTNGRANLEMGQDSQFGANVVMNFLGDEAFILNGTTQTLAGVNAGSKNQFIQSLIANEGSAVPPGDGTLILNGAETYTYSAYIEDGGATFKLNLVCDGGGYQTLAGAGYQAITYTGTTTISDGNSLELFDTYNYASPTTVNTGATLILNSNSNPYSWFVVYAPLNLAGGTLSYISPGGVLWIGLFNPTGASTLNFTSNGTNYLNFELGMSGSGTLTVNQTGPIGDGSGLYGAGTGVDFDNSNGGKTGNFSGSMIVNNGDIRIEPPAATWFQNAAITLNNSRLRQAGPIAIGSLYGNGTVNSQYYSSTLTLGAGDFSGTITEGNGAPGSLVKNTGGILRLSGPSNYTGTTVVNGGILRLAGDTGSLTGTSSVTINGTGSTFDIDNSGTGTIAHLPTTATITLNGGTFSMASPLTGATANRVETIQSLTLAPGSGTNTLTLTASPTSTLGNAILQMNGDFTTNGQSLAFTRTSGTTATANWLFDLSPGPQPTGTHYPTVTVIEPNVTSFGIYKNPSVGMVADVTPPLVSAGPNDDVYQGLEAGQLFGSASAVSPATGIASLAWTCTKAPGSSPAIAQANINTLNGLIAGNNSGLTLTFATGTLPQGDYTLQLTATDNVGGQASASAYVRVYSYSTQNLTGLAVTRSPATPLLAAPTSSALTITATSTTTYKLPFVNVIGVEYRFSKSVNSGALTVIRDWSTVNSTTIPAGLATGYYQFYVEARIGTATNPNTLPDGQPPEITAYAPDLAVGISESVTSVGMSNIVAATPASPVTTFTVTSTQTANVPVYYNVTKSLNGGAYTSVANWQWQLVTASANGTFSAVIADTSPANGVYTYKVQASTISGTAQATTTNTTAITVGPGVSAMSIGAVTVSGSTVSFPITVTVSGNPSVYYHVARSFNAGPYAVLSGWNWQAGTGTSTAFSDATLTAAGIYTYQVEASPSATGPYTAYVFSPNIAIGPSVTAVSVGAINVSGSTVSFPINATFSGAGTVYYHVARSINGSAYAVLSGWNWQPGTGTAIAFSDPAASANGIYTYQVEASTSATGPYTAYVFTPNIVIGPTVTAVSVGTATISGSTVSFPINVTVNGVANVYYHVAKSVNGGAYTLVNGWNWQAGTGTSALFSDTTATVNGTYWYQVEASISPTGPYTAYAFKTVTITGN